MDEQQRIAQEAEFRGRVLAKLEGIEDNICTLFEKIEAVQDIRDEVTRLKAWAGILGASAGIAGSILAQFLNRHIG